MENLTMATDNNLTIDAKPIVTILYINYFKQQAQ